MPASPAETVRPCTECGHRIRTELELGDTAHFGADCPDCPEGVCQMPTVTATELTTLRAAACPDPTLHAVADAPLRPLSDLLRTATEFDEIAGHLVDEYDLLAIELARIDALRAAVRALQGPPAPFRPQQAHAAPAKCNAACFEHPAKGGEA